MFVIRELTTDEDIASAFPLMHELRDRIQADTFIEEVHRQQEESYFLLGGAVDGEWVVLAGVRLAHTLARGEHLFVDDLVTASGVQGKGYGKEMMRHIAELAEKRGLSRLYLDSRNTARGFYLRVGFTFGSASPCWIETSKLLSNEPPRPHKPHKAQQPHKAKKPAAKQSRRK